MFPNRVVLGIGIGESLNEVPVTGMRWPEPKERLARLREAVPLIRRLWSEDRVTFEGEYYATESATIYDRPARMLPIYIAGAGSMIAKFAGRRAEGFICTSGKRAELYSETLLPNLDVGLAAAGRDGAAIDRMIEMPVASKPAIAFSTACRRDLNEAMAPRRASHRIAREMGHQHRSIRVEGLCELLVDEAMRQLRYEDIAADFLGSHRIVPPSGLSDLSRASPPGSAYLRA
jgi:alkanesulfonate monooxygenase SsuD/methylene tetrahydromethanopterin reductase-like flavin-dependent oxidoreductase (luciferase family)